MTKAKPGAHHRMDDSRRHAMPEAKNEIERTYIRYMQAEGLSPETVRQRIYLLRGLGRPAEQVTVDDVLALVNGRDLGAHSRARYVSVLRSVFADLERIGIVGDNPVRLLKTPRTPRRSPRPITMAELEALETLAETFPREYAWTILGAYAGMRAGEVCSITGTALRDGEHGPVIRVQGKGGVDALIPAHEKVVQVLSPLRSIKEPLWPLWPQSLMRAWTVAAASVGVEGRKFHQLRHTFATRLTRAGVDLLVIADLCRHASVATTQRYAQVADGAPSQAIDLL